ncbi:MAG TPA: phosphoribosylamine--glycine ligase [Kofleriaceae bacterium]|nr:phosphoribosylamine--glycine ligase [Kofleriaceae bacterium]
MHILVVGGGGREHALVWRLARAGHRVVAAPGNPGIAAIAECAPIGAGDLDGLEALALERHVDLVVIGPEAPLVAGLGDRLRARGLLVFGPSRAAAQLEGSKTFSKEFFARHGIRSADFATVTGMAELDAAIARLGDRVVVKADGLAAGKGVVVCSSRDQARAAARRMLEERAFGEAGQRVVIEQRLEGHELSVMALTDGTRYEVLAQAEDHKTIFDGDRGPNTGGMGTVSPAPWATEALIDRVRREIFDPTLTGLAGDGLDYRGVLYAGIMVAPDGVPWILEYNCRFGDPETQPVMCRFASDPGEWLAGAAAGALPTGSIQWDARAAVCVVLAAADYPEAPRKGDRISGLDELEADDLVVFHAGTALVNGSLVTAGGRVLGVTALGADVTAARARAYAAVDRIEFEGKQFRRDIGAREEHV